MESTLTLGEYMRRLRRDKNWSLMQLAEETGVSYSHLSRIENDSTLPNTETVAKLATSLGGNLPAMLELARCLPKVILDRIAETASDRESARLLRSAMAGADATRFPDRLQALAVLLGQLFDLPADQARELAVGVETLALFPADRRTALVSFLQSERGGAGGGIR